MTRVRGVYEMPGSPQLLARLPSPALLREAGAGRTATAVERALGLRDSSAAARTALGQARMGVKAAETQDRREHAALVARDATAKLEPRHAEEARREVEEAERRLEALAAAVDTATDDLMAAAGNQREQIADAARATREQVAQEVRDAGAQVAAAVDRLEAMLSAARWSAEPENRHWPPPAPSPTACPALGASWGACSAAGSWGALDSMARMRSLLDGGELRRVVEGPARLRTYVRERAAAV